MNIKEFATVVAVNIMLILSATALMAQTQNQNQQQNQQAQQQNQQQQNQQQPTKKLTFWQRMKEQARQAGQNSTQQGMQTVQQGTQQVQQGVQGVQQQVQQNVQGVQQLPGQTVQQVSGQMGSNTAFGGGSGMSSCGSSCFDAGPFQAMVTQMTLSQQGYWHIIRMNIQFHNASNQPLIIAYRDGSMVMVDNNGNTYIPAGGNPGQLQGMGIDRGNQTDSGFQLGPGQTGSAMFTVARQRGNDSAVGTDYTYNFTIDELQAQNGAQAAVVRQYNLNFPSLAPSTIGNSGASNGFLGGNSGTGTTTTNGYMPGAVATSGVTRGVNGSVISPATAANTTAGATKGTAIGTAAQRPLTPAAQRNLRQPVRPVMPARTGTAATAVNNAALRTPATVSKPSPAVRPVPAVTAKKPAATTAKPSTGAK